MRRRDGGVVNTCSLLCPMLALRGNEVILLSCEDDELDPRRWTKVDGLSLLPPGATLPAFEPSPAGGLKPMSVRVPLANPLASLRGKSPYDSDRDKPTEMLPARSRDAARVVLRGADVLYLHGMWPTSNVQLARIAREMGVPYAVSPHGMLDDWCMAQGGFKKRLFMRLFGRRLLDGARCVHFEGSEEMRQGRKFTSAPVTVGPPPPIDPRPFAGRPGEALALEKFPGLSAARGAGCASLLYIGRITEKKGPDKLLFAAKAWKEKGVPVRVFFAGGGYPPEYADAMHALAKSLGVADMCEFLGMVTGEEKWSLLRAVDMVVLPTSQENFGIVLVEALAVGTPVLTTRAVDIWPELEASGGAAIVEGGVGVAAQVAERVEEMVRDRAALRAMGETGMAWALGLEEPTGLAAWYERMLAGESAQ